MGSADKSGTSGTAKPSGLVSLPAERGTGEVDEAFKRSMASLSHQLAARFADSPPPTGAGAGLRTQPSIASRWVPPDEDVSRTSSFALMLAFALGAIASAAGVYAFEVDLAPRPPPVAVVATPASLRSPVPDAVPPPPAPATVDVAPAVQPPPVATPPVKSNAPEPAPAVAWPGQHDLSTAEILELQTRLDSLGLQPGAVDGILGPRTVMAIRRYEDSRGQAQSGKADRELLERLRAESN